MFAPGFFYAFGITGVDVTCWICRFVLGLLLSVVAIKASAQDTSTTPSNAAEGLRLGVLINQVSLLGDPGEGSRNAVGFGLEATYQIEPALAVAIRYVMSNHSNVDHKEVNLGVEYSIGEYESAFPYVAGGLAFHDNKLKTIDRSGDAVGAYLALGANFNIAQKLWLAPEIRYTKVSPTHVEISGRSVDTVADSYAVALRLLYAF